MVNEYLPWRKVWLLAYDTYAAFSVTYAAHCLDLRQIDCLNTERALASMDCASYKECFTHLRLEVPHFSPR